MLKSIILLYSLVNVGDVSHGTVLAEKLKQAVPGLEVTLIDANLSANDLEAEYNKIQTKLTPQDSMVLAIGEKGLSALSILNQAKYFENSKVPLGASVHMYFDTIQSLPLNFLAIPETESKKGTFKHIPNTTFTLTVPSKNPSLNELKTAYEKWEPMKKPPADGSYIVVMLPGDAIDGKEMKFFTQSSAKKLAENVIALRKQHGEKYVVIVQNSPRTGKHNPKNGEIICSHEYKKGSDPNVAIDEVSQYFIELLNQDNVPNYFFNFAFEQEDDNKKKALSVFNPLLYLAQVQQDNYFIVPGESTTMLGQVPLYLKPSQVIIFKPNSMNASHEAIFEVLKNRGHLSYFSDDSVTAPKHPVQLKSDDTSVVVDNLLKIFEPKAKPSFSAKLKESLESIWNRIVDLIHHLYTNLKNKFSSKPKATTGLPADQIPPKEAPIYPSSKKMEAAPTKLGANDESPTLKSTKALIH